jgi:hypothetical protein
VKASPRRVRVPTSKISWVWWFKPVFPGTPETEVKGSTTEGSPSKVSTHLLNKLKSKMIGSGVQVGRLA